MTVDERGITPPDLVGVMTRAKTPKGSSERRWRMGRAKAAVLPLPVFAQPIQSLPSGRGQLKHQVQPRQPKTSSLYNFSLPSRTGGMQ